MDINQPTHKNSTFIPTLCAMLMIHLCGQCIPAVAQKPKLINGKVLSLEQGTAIMGATVKVLGTTAVTFTDDYGVFELNAFGNKIVIQVTHIGYDTLTREIAPNMGQTIIIHLSGTPNQLDEIKVSTGYEEVSMAHATGSFEKVDNTLLNRGVGMDILGRLENVTSGIHFERGDASFTTTGRPTNHNIFIHGVSTLRGINAGGNTPLIILDNFPYDGDINNLNPNDIESVTILKDAAASSIWGAKAGNGVIVITSKQSKYEAPLSVSLTTNFNLIARPNLFAHRVIQTADLLDVEMLLFEKGYYNNKENSAAKPALSPVVEILIRQRNGELTEEQANRQIEAYRKEDIRHDMLKYMYREAFQQQYAMNVSGGGRVNKFVAGLGYDKSLPTRVGDEFSRLTVRLENALKPLDGLEVRGSIRWNVNRSITTNGEGGYTDAGHPFPYSRLADSRGNPLPTPLDYRLGYLDTAGAGRLLDWHFRPLELVNNPPHRNNAQELILGAEAKYWLSRGLSMTINYQHERGVGLATSYHDIDSYYARNLINRGTEIHGNSTVYHFPYGGILQQQNSNRMSHRGRSQLDYKRQWTLNEVSILGGVEVQQNNTASTGFNLYGYDNELLTYANQVDFTKQYPVYDNLASVGRMLSPFQDPQETINRFVSVYVNATNVFAKRYTLTASARRDASNLFGVSTNNKWTPLWSAGIAWNLSNEAFFNVGVLPFLKLRASYGYSGNVDNSMTALTQIVYTNNAPLTQVDWAAAHVNTPPNPELRWERVKTVNIGADFVFLRPRISGTMDLYRKSTFDLLHPYPTDPTVGVSSIVMNVANTESYGIDFRLNNQSSFGNFNLSTDFLFSYNNNWVGKSFVEYSGPSWYVGQGRVSEVEGTLVFPLYSYGWAGLNPETGMPRGLINNEITENYGSIFMGSNTGLDDLVFHGSSRPLYFGSIRNTLRCKSISLSINMSWKLAYFFRRASIDYNRLANLNDGHIDYYDRWQNPGDELFTDVPSFIYPIDSRANTFYAHSEVLVEKGDHIRLQDLRVSYDLPKMKSIRLSAANVFVYANNIGFIWRANRLKLDPDVVGNIPPSRSLAIGLNFHL